MSEESISVGASSRFAANLRALRVAADLSQEELAFRADIHRTQISLIEGGHRLPRLDTLIKLCGALLVTPNDLLEGISWEASIYRSGRFILEAREAGDDD